ncbi:GNAT family N-acetyltransferase [Clostridium sp. HMP27]|uniref:GNAT family N-acetyltransferase n=1 Tax=Clostridium sp. HMP27 TaxID=1487921 RepID=UPI00052C6F58|nr:GNAT family N-acetyltransferase [Clostridium sp. HMP27]KGK88188.1 GCN5 family acetyltransferase [Clostridium sp. HMP27]
MFKKLDLTNMKIAESVLQLQIASYKIEAELIGFYEIPPLKDTIDSLTGCDEIFYGYFITDILAGLISYKINENILDIHRVAVHPCFFKRGIAGKMISFIEKIEDTINKAVVCTGKENLPAVNLYLKNGYHKVKDIEISKGIYLTEFAKTF